MRRRRRADRVSVRSRRRRERRSSGADGAGPRMTGGVAGAQRGGGEVAEAREVGGAKVQCTRRGGMRAGTGGGVTWLFWGIVQRCGGATERNGAKAGNWGKVGVGCSGVGSG